MLDDYQRITPSFNKKKKKRKKKEGKMKLFFVNLHMLKVIKIPIDPNFS